MNPRSFDQQLEGARQAEAAAARALAEQVSNKNPVALWLDSILGTPAVAKAPVNGSSKVASVGMGNNAVLGAADGDGSSENKSYFQSSIAAYALGLGLCFGVNYISKSGQPGEW